MSDHDRQGQENKDIEEEKANEREPLGVLIAQTTAMPRDVNINGDIFGGWIVSQMDLAGGMFAREIACSRMVTATIQNMVFQRPVHVGDTVSIHAALMRVGNSSLDVQLEVWAKELRSETSVEQRVVTEGVFRYVAIDDRGRPRRIPDNPRFFTRNGDTFERRIDDRRGG